MPSSVSKSLPTVSKLTGPVLGAVQKYQMDFPPASPAWLGSPICFVAPTELPLKLPMLQPMTWPLAKSSLKPELTAKIPTLMAVPPGVVTLMGPAVAPAGTVVAICVELLTVKLALVPLKRTAVAPVKFAPLIRTFVPVEPIVGVKLVMDGALVLKVQLRTTLPESPL